MSFDFTLFIPFLFAYLIGSVPTSVWVSRVFYKIDIRNEGSKNAGATNTIRVLGLKAGLPVLAFDIFKGWFAVYLLNFFNFPELSLEMRVYLEISMGVAAIVGHIFPVYVGFRGGKGVATIAGVAIALFPIGVLLILGVFVLCFLITRIVSISSIIAGISFPLIIIFVMHNPHLPLQILAVGVGIFIPLTHRKNIQRLLKGKEKRFSFKRSRQ